MDDIVEYLRVSRSSLHVYLFFSRRGVAAKRNIIRDDPVIIGRGLHRPIDRVPVKGTIILERFHTKTTCAHIVWIALSWWPCIRNIDVEAVNHEPNKTRIWGTWIWVISTTVSPNRGTSGCIDLAIYIAWIEGDTEI